MTEYPHVFSPLKIGNVVLKNRIEAVHHDGFNVAVELEPQVAWRKD